MVVLGWLNSESSRLKTYVDNRVEQILDGTDVSQWRYINTKDNPADIISRGIDAQELARSVMWWNGPSYLSLPETQWSHPTIKLTPCYELPEQRPVKLVFDCNRGVNGHYQRIFELAVTCSCYYLAVTVFQLPQKQEVNSSARIPDTKGDQIGRSYNFKKSTKRRIP
ncbi:unnamed protein product [Macrosiphum euphorbiae]|uniref:Uncharacterized protein n=1 Tax=Macrosiphum euphorbiae TaxID=13131 RepID=A0AAV0Y4A1_9HEMI|nr:unnamed protein product [Macrosiphum euphorbiae]